MIHRLGEPKTKMRETVSLIQIPKSYQSYSIATGQLVSEGGPTSYYARKLKETISSTNRLSSKSSKANNCLHTKESTVVNAGGSQSIKWYSAANPTVLELYHAAGASAQWALSTVLPSALNSLSVSGGNYLRNNAVRLMTENFDSLRPDLTELSVPNFILDLDQISKLFKFWKYGKSLTKNLANANLNYQFGWRPTIGDAKAAFGAVSSLQSKLEAFRKRLGKLSRKQIVADSGAESHTGTITQDGYTLKWTCRREYTCSAYIAYRPLPIKEMTAFETYLRGTLDQLGFEINAEIVWDAIPFSFILDWFLDVGLLARQFRLDTLELPIKLEDSYLQYKERVVVDCHSRYLATSEHTGTDRPGASYEVVTFHRMSAQPDYQSLVWSGWHLPSLNQAVLSLSLGLSR